MRTHINCLDLYLNNLQSSNKSGKINFLKVRNFVEAKKTTEEYEEKTKALADELR